VNSRSGFEAEPWTESQRKNAIGALIPRWPQANQFAALGAAKTEKRGPLRRERAPRSLVSGNHTSPFFAGDVDFTKTRIRDACCWGPCFADGDGDGRWGSLRNAVCGLPAARKTSRWAGGGG